MPCDIKHWIIHFSLVRTLFFCPLPNWSMKRTEFPLRSRNLHINPTQKCPHRTSESSLSLPYPWCSLFSLLKMNAICSSILTQQLWLCGFSAQCYVYIREIYPLVVALTLTAHFSANHFSPLIPIGGRFEFFQFLGHAHKIFDEITKWENWDFSCELIQKGWFLGVWWRLWWFEGEEGKPSWASSPSSKVIINHCLISWFLLDSILDTLLNHPVSCWVLSFFTWAESVLVYLWLYWYIFMFERCFEVISTWVCQFFNKVFTFIGCDLLSYWCKHCIYSCFPHGPCCHLRWGDTVEVKQELWCKASLHFYTCQSSICISSKALSFEILAASAWTFTIESDCRRRPTLLFWWAESDNDKYKEK